MALRVVRGAAEWCPLARSAGCRGCPLVARGFSPPPCSASVTAKPSSPAALNSFRCCATPTAGCAHPRWAGNVAPGAAGAAATQCQRQASRAPGAAVPFSPSMRLPPYPRRSPSTTSASGRRAQPSGRHGGGRGCSTCAATPTTWWRPTTASSNTTSDAAGCSAGGHALRLGCGQRGGWGGRSRGVGGRMQWWGGVGVGGTMPGRGQGGGSGGGVGAHWVGRVQRPPQLNSRCPLPPAVGWSTSSSWLCGTSSPTTCMTVPASCWA